MFKAQRLDGKGKIEGWLVVHKDIKHNLVYSIIKDKIDIWEYDTTNTYLKVNDHSFIKVIPSTISMQTGQTDKNGKDIYGSIEIDSVMTKGGDIVKVTRWDSFKPYISDVYFAKGSFYTYCEYDKKTRTIPRPEAYPIHVWEDKGYEIIGKQYEEDNV